VFHRTRRRLAAAISLILALAAVLPSLPCAAAALDAVPVPPDALRLPDGRELALSGLVLDAGACPGPLSINPGEITGKDRHGRLLAEARTPEGRDVAFDLVARGCALVDPTVLPRRLAEALLFAEKHAEQKKRGLWRHDPVEDAARVRDASFRFALVEGTVRHVARAGRDVYLDFGRGSREDLSLRLDPAVQKELFADGAGPEDLVGHRVRARGWILRQNGPMIHVTTVLQLEIAP